MICSILEDKFVVLWNFVKIYWNMRKAFYYKLHFGLCVLLTIKALMLQRGLHWLRTLDKYTSTAGVWLFQIAIQVLLK